MAGRRALDWRLLRARAADPRRTDRQTRLVRDARHGVQYAEVARAAIAGLPESDYKRALLWMASRAPAWVTSDRLTVLGLSAQVGAGIGPAAASGAGTDPRHHHRGTRR